MSYGLNLYDADGSLMVSNKGRLMHYIGTATYVSTNSFPTFYVYEVNSPGGYPLPFIRFQPGNGVTYGVKRVYLHSGTTYRIEVSASSGGTALTIDCFAALSSTTPTGSHGFQVFTDAGLLSFDSTRKPLAFDAVVTLDAYSGNTTSITAWGTSVSVTWPSGTLAFMAQGSGVGRQMFQSGPGFYAHYTPNVSIASSSITRALGPRVAPSSPTGTPGAIFQLVLKDETVFCINMDRYL